MKIKRYDHVPRSMIISETGEFVRYDDAIAAAAKVVKKVGEDLMVAMLAELAVLREVLAEDETL